MHPPAVLAPLARTADPRTVEAAASGLRLKERAGRPAPEVARSLSGERSGAVLVLAGPGNNGGDAFVVAHRLCEWYFEVSVVFRGDARKLPADAAAAHHAFVKAGGATAETVPPGWDGALILDGLFGGLRRAASPEYAALIDWANASGVPILALDVPSGLDADTGAAYGPAIRATATATFIANAYLSHYGKNLSNESLARIWQGGPKGLRKSSTRAYGKRVMRKLHSLEGANRSFTENPTFTAR